MSIAVSTCFRTLVFLDFIMLYQYIEWGDIYSFIFCSQKCAECSRTIIGGTSNNRQQTQIKLVWIRMRSNWSNIRSWTVGSIQFLLWIPNIPVKNPENNYWTPKNVRLGRWRSFWTWSVFSRVNKAVPPLSHVIQGAPLSHRQLTNIYRLHPRIWGDVPPHLLLKTTHLSR